MRLSDIVALESCLVTRVWGFSPETWGAMGFPKAGTVVKWLGRTTPVHAICFVSHHAAVHIQEADRGRVLGVYELSPHKVALEDDNVLDLQHLNDATMRHNDGRFRWPIGLRATRAWRFDKPPRTREAMPHARRLGFDVSTDLIPINRQDYALLNQLQYQLTEVAVYGLPFSAKRLADPISTPSSVYLFACAKQEVLVRLPGWRQGDVLVKVGCTADVVGRLASFNDHPLARIFGLKLAKVAERYVGSDTALIEESTLLSTAAFVGRPASKEQTEFFYMSDMALRTLQLKMANIVRVA